MTFQFSVPTSIIVQGPSFSGKTSLLIKLIKNQREIFDKSFSRIVYCYAIWSDELADQLSDVKNLEFHKGLPFDLVQTIEEKKDNDNILFVVDDLQIESSTKKGAELMQSLFIRMRHLNISVIYTVHNLYQDSKFSLIIRRNAQAIIVLNATNSQQVMKKLSCQIFDGDKCSTFLPLAFQTLKKLTNYPYIVLNIRPGISKDLTVISNIFPDEYPIRVFVP